MSSSTPIPTEIPPFDFPEGSVRYENGEHFLTYRKTDRITIPKESERMDFIRKERTRLMNENPGNKILESINPFKTHLSFRRENVPLNESKEEFHSICPLSGIRCSRFEKVPSQVFFVNRENLTFEMDENYLYYGSFWSVAHMDKFEAACRDAIDPTSELFSSFTVPGSDMVDTLYQNLIGYKKHMIGSYNILNPAKTSYDKFFSYLPALRIAKLVVQKGKLYICADYSVEQQLNELGYHIDPHSHEISSKAQFEGFTHASKTSFNTLEWMCITFENGVIKIRPLVPLSTEMSNVVENQQIVDLQPNQENLQAKKVVTYEKTLTFEDTTFIRTVLVDENVLEFVNANTDKAELRVIFDENCIHVEGENLSKSYPFCNSLDDLYTQIYGDDKTMSVIATPVLPTTRPLEFLYFLGKMSVCYVKSYTQSNGTYVCIIPRQVYPLFATTAMSQGYSVS